MCVRVCAQVIYCVVFNRKKKSELRELKTEGMSLRRCSGCLEQALKVCPVWVWNVTDQADVDLENIISGLLNVPNGVDMFLHHFWWRKHISLIFIFNSWLLFSHGFWAPDEWNNVFAGRTRRLLTCDGRQDQVHSSTHKSFLLRTRKDSFWV